MIEQIAIEVNSNNFEEMQNSTITTVDFASQKISFDVKVTKKLQSNQEFHKLTELMVDIVGNQIRKKVRHLFNLKGRLWIARYVETKHQGVSCDRFLGRTHAPRTPRFRTARTRVRTSNLKGSHFAPAPAHLR